MITIRPYDLVTDLPGMAFLLSVTHTEPVNEEQVQEWWQPSQDEIRQTLIAFNERGEAIALGDICSNVWMPPRVYSLNLIVAPEWRQQGIGANLYDQSLQFATNNGAVSIECSVREGEPDGRQFMEQRGFQLVRRRFESVLDLANFDEQPLLPAIDRCEAAGIRFFSMANLEPVAEAHERKLYELNRAAALDNPGSSSVFPPFEDFHKFVFAASWYRADGQILAADGERWIGLAAIAYYPEIQAAYNAFTGVDRAYRGRGLATALKLLATRRAREYGAKYIRTHNDSRNAAMLAVNAKFGYRPEPGLLILDRKIYS